MELLISDKVQIADLQKKFSQEFPYLKVEFFSLAHVDHHGLPRSQMYASSLILGSCRKKHNEGHMTISQKDTVGAVEKAFWEQFGLTAEIFRKSGKIWIETTLSDAWTLERQNEEGKAFTLFTNEPKAEREDQTDRDIWG